jgi:AcrR family transcriptional regulator
MPAGVNPKRRYDSPHRRQQAEATRAHIVETAQRLFERDGYPATTVAGIAEEAGVAVKTVYLAFETKSGLMRAVWDQLLRGAEDRPVADQPWYREVLAERDPRRQLRLNARNSRAVKVRLGRVLIVIREAAVVDDDMAALWHLIETDFYENQRVIVQALHDGGELRVGLDVARATDILWSLNHPDVWHLLAGVRGWPPDRYEEWFAETTITQLLKPRRGRAS